MKLPPGARFPTICIHAGQTPDPGTGAIITPIFQTSTYVQEELGKHKGFEYARTQNPTRAALEANIAAIEGGKAAFAFASGMAAIDAITTMLEAGDHVVVTDNTYGGTFRLFDKVLTRYKLEFSYVDTSQPDLVERAMRPNTKMLFVETPTNPVLRLTDIAEDGGDRAPARRAPGRRQHVRQPRRAAADRARRRPRHPQHDEVPERPQRQHRRRRHRDARRGRRVAAVHPERRRGDPQPVRFVAGPARHQDADGPDGAAQRQRAWRSPSSSPTHPKVTQVIYPGLPDHPQHDLAKRQMRGFGGMVSFDVGTFEAARAVCNRVKLMSLAESLGGVETLISHPAHDDARLGAAGAPPGDRPDRQPGADLGGHRRSGGSDRRS